MGNDISLDSNKLVAMIETMRTVNTNLIDGAVEDGNNIIALLESSDSEFVTNLKDEISMEIGTITTIGFMFESLCNFISAAAADFINIDNTYDH